MTVEYEADYRSCSTENPVCGVVDRLHLTLHVDSGSSTGGLGDLAMGIQWSDSCYFHENFRCVGSIYKTPRPNNTACRAPGVIQSIPAHEYVLQHIADNLGVCAEIVRERNFYKVNDKTFGGNVIGQDGFNWTIPQLWEQAKTKSCFETRKAKIESYNAENRWRKRGISLVPVKYNMEEAGYALGALVSIYAADGSVEVVHGGVEIGQGINTKVAQSVAYTLGCDLDQVEVGENSTRTTANSSVTGGSGTSESSCRAAMRAAQELADRLKPFRDATAEEDTTWAAIVEKASKAGVSLSATGWTDVQTKHDFAYATYGACVSEVGDDVFPLYMQRSLQVVLTSVVVRTNDCSGYNTKNVLVTQKIPVQTDLHACSHLLHRWRSTC